MNPRGNDRIRILYAISSLANEGPTRVLLNLIRNLDRSRYDPTVLTFVPEKQSSIRGDFDLLGLPIIHLSNWKSSGLLPAFLEQAREFRRIIRKQRFAIVHSHCPRSLLYLAFLGPSEIKKAHTVHHNPSAQYRALWGPIAGRMLTFLTRIAMGLIDRPIACSESVAMEYMETQHRKILAVNNGIEPLVALNVPRQRNATLVELGLDPRNRYIVSVGRLSTEKRIAEFVATFSKLNLPGVHLIVVGDGPEEGRIRALAGINTHLVGFQSNTVPFMLAGDFFVLPSATEGLSISLLEAMSVGVPSLLSDIPSHQYVLARTSGKVGLLFDPTSVDDVRNKVASLVLLDKDHIRDGIRKSFCIYYHARVMAKAYQDIYESMY